MIKVKEEYKDIIVTELPCWFALSWKEDVKEPAILLRVHEDRTKDIPFKLKNIGYVKEMKKTLKSIEKQIKMYD